MSIFDRPSGHFELPNVDIQDGQWKKVRIALAGLRRAAEFTTFSDVEAAPAESEAQSYAFSWMGF